MHITTTLLYEGMVKGVVETATPSYKKNHGSSLEQMMKLYHTQYTCRHET